MWQSYGRLPFKTFTKRYAVAARTCPEWNGTLVFVEESHIVALVLAFFSDKTLLVLCLFSLKGIKEATYRQISKIN